MRLWRYHSTLAKDCHRAPGRDIFFFNLSIDVDYGRRVCESVGRRVKDVKEISPTGDRSIYLYITKGVFFQCKSTAFQLGHATRLGQWGKDRATASLGQGKGGGNGLWRWNWFGTI